MAILIGNSKDVPSSLPRKQLLNHVVDERAKNHPEALYSEIPYSVSSYKSGYRKVTYADFANAINGLAHLIHQTLGPGENFPTLAYIGVRTLFILFFVFV